MKFPVATWLVVILFDVLILSFLMLEADARTSTNAAFGFLSRPTGTGTGTPKSETNDWYVALHTLATLSVFSIGMVFSEPVHASGDISRGKLLFNQNCAACHVGGGNVMSEQRTLQKAALEKYVGMDPDRVQSFVQNSMRHKMMAFPAGKLTDENFADVATFIVDQAAGDKW